jgi:hypothetical protein
MSYFWGFFRAQMKQCLEAKRSQHAEGPTLLQTHRFDLKPYNIDGKYYLIDNLFLGKCRRCRNTLFLNEYERFVTGISFRTILFDQNVPNWLVHF